MQPYPAAFYSGITKTAVDSARVVVPMVCDLIHPQSVIDVGCGVGAWLRAFREQGIERTVGVDLPAFDEKQLLIPKGDYHSCNLTGPPPPLGRFDLVLSLEVAEHLPAAAAATFVATLVGYGEVVLFSAAIPHQPGTHHVNCQWPQFWAEQFASKDYVLIDCLRTRLWDNPQVAPWYAQNLFLFVDRRRLASHPVLASEAGRSPAVPLALVHPRILEHILHDRSLTFSGLVKSIPGVILQSVRHRFRRA